MTNPDNTKLDAEREQVARYIRAALKAGYALSVLDGEEWVLKFSTDEQAVLAVMFTTDGDVIQMDDHGRRVGALYFVYGNEPDEVLCDHSDNPATRAIVDAAEQEG